MIREFITRLRSRAKEMAEALVGKIRSAIPSMHHHAQPLPESTPTLYKLNQEMHWMQESATG